MSYKQHRYIEHLKKELEASNKENSALHSEMIVLINERDHYRDRVPVLAPSHFNKGGYVPSLGGTEIPKDNPVLDVVESFLCTPLGLFLAGGATGLLLGLSVWLFATAFHLAIN